MNASVLWDIVSRAKIECPRPQAEWHSILRGTLYPIGHERSLSNRVRTWSHPRSISFLRADCIFAFSFFSSYLEITLLFCLRYFHYCTHAFEVQCFRVLHRAVYRSWCVNSHEPIHGNLELEAVITAKDLLDLHWWKQYFEALQPPTPASGEPAGNSKRPN